MKNQLVAIIDTREQMPLNTEPLISKRGTLSTGDYSIEGYENLITVEVKALSDFVGCCTHSRDRFERELVRMREYPYRAIVVKSTWSAIELKQYHGATHPNAVLGSAMAFAMSAQVPIIMSGGGYVITSKLVARLLWVAGNRCQKGLTGCTNNVITMTDVMNPTEKGNPCNPSETP